jgi:hypothetical protein
MVWQHASVCYTLEMVASAKYAKDLAKGALRLLERCNHGQDNSDIELAAALMAVHVCDWYFIRDLGQKEVLELDKEKFAKANPDCKRRETSETTETRPDDLSNSRNEMGGCGRLADSPGNQHTLCTGERRAALA